MTGEEILEAIEAVDLQVPADEWASRQAAARLLRFAGIKRVDIYCPRTFPQAVATAEATQKKWARKQQKRLLGKVNRRKMAKAARETAAECIRHAIVTAYIGSRAIDQHVTAVIDDALPNLPKELIPSFRVAVHRAVNSLDWPYQQAIRKIAKKEIQRIPLSVMERRIDQVAWGKIPPKRPSWGQLTYRLQESAKRRFNQAEWWNKLRTFSARGGGNWIGDLTAPIANAISVRELIRSHNDLAEYWLDLWKAGVAAVFPLPKTLVLVLRPQVWVENGRLHRDDGPAMIGRGIEEWVWRGVRVPKQVITEADSLDLQKILGERNAEVRAAMIDRVGGGRLLEMAGATAPAREDEHGALYYLTVSLDGKIQSRKNPMPRETWGNNEWRNVNYAIGILAVTCPSSGRRFWLFVDPESETPKAAVASTFEMTADQWKPEQHT